MNLLMHFRFDSLYIGPGIGSGTLVAIIGILSSFVLSLIAIFWYPLKKFVRYIRSKFGKNK